MSKSETYQKMKAQIEAMPVVPYADVRPLLKTGDKVLCCGTAAFSRLIQFGTKSPFSHILNIYVNKDIDRVLAQESRESKGINEIRFSRYLEDYSNSGKAYPGQLVVFRNPAWEKLAVEFPDRYKAAMQFATDNLGQEYPKWKIVKLAYRILNTKKEIPEYDWTANQELICSEFCQGIDCNLGLALSSHDNNYMTPGDFAIDNGYRPHWRLL